MSQSTDAAGARKIASMILATLQLETARLLLRPTQREDFEAWAAFMADEEWAAIKKETGARHGRFVDAISDRTLEPAPYSPDRAGAGG